MLHVPITSAPHHSRIRSSGVTLLEIMLVLAIAVMIIVISVRYYQAASASQQANTFLAQLYAIQTVADQLAASTSSYQAILRLLSNRFLSKH